jgi:DNA ligase-1
MKFEDFAELNEELQEMTPTQSVAKVSRIILGMDDQEHSLLGLLAKDYPNSGVGEAGLVKRICEMIGAPEWNLQQLIDDEGTLPDAIKAMVGPSRLDDIVLNELEIADVMDELTMGTAESIYEMYFDNYPTLSRTARKWLTAFLLKKPRNGIGESEVKKMLCKTYGYKAKEMKKAASFLTIEELITQSVMNGKLHYAPTVGKFMTPMLAKTIKHRIANKCIVDYKYDGIRAQVHVKKNGEVTIFNRRGDDVTHRYRDMATLTYEELDLASMGTNVILDGEIYPINEDGTPADFKLMGSRIHGKEDDVIYRQDVTVRFFDLLYWDNESYFNKPYLERFETMQQAWGASYLIAENKMVTTQDEMLEYYQQAIDDGFEGVIVKSLDSHYDFGARSYSWSKFKPPTVDVDCWVTGVTRGKGKRAGYYGSYDIAILDGLNVIPFGSVGSGFSDSDLKFLTEMYDEKGPEQMIIEVKGDIVTQDESGNYGLRFPRYVKYRDDKTEPTDISELKIGE